MRTERSREITRKVSRWVRLSFRSGTGDDGSVTEIVETVEDDPDEFEDHVETLAGWLAGTPAERAAGARCFAAAAETHPQLVSFRSPALADCLSADDPETRLDALEALSTARVRHVGSTLGKSELYAVHSALDDESVAVAEAAADLLADVAKDDAEAVDTAVVRSALDDADDDVVVALLDVLATIAPERPDEIVEHRRAVTGLLDATTSEVVTRKAADVLEELLESEDTGYSWEWDGADEVFDALFDCYLTSENDKTRSKVGRPLVLGFWLDHRWTFVDKLEEFEADLRKGHEPAAAAFWIGALTDQDETSSYLPALGDALDAPDPELGATETTAEAIVVTADSRPAPVRESSIDPERALRLAHGGPEMDQECDRCLSVAEEFDVSPHDISPESEDDSSSDADDVSPESEDDSSSDADDVSPESEDDPSSDTGDDSESGTFRAQRPETTFEDCVGVGGVEELVADRIEGPIQEPGLYEEFDVGLEHGFLFHGPPGTGKTHVARAIAGELGFSFFEARMADLQHTKIGESSKAVEDLFEQARGAQPSLVFVDEIDTAGLTRGVSQTKGQRELLTTMLECLSEIDRRNDEIVVVGATNRIDDVDRALLRTGRLGRHVEFGPPDDDERVALLDHYCGARIDADDDWLADATEEFVHSDVAKLAEEAGIEAIRRLRDDEGPDHIVRSDVAAALERVDSTDDDDDGSLRQFQ